MKKIINIISLIIIACLAGYGSAQIYDSLGTVYGIIVATIFGFSCGNCFRIISKNINQ